MTDPTRARKFFENPAAGLSYLVHVVVAKPLHALCDLHRRGANQADLGLDFAAAGPIVANDEPDSHYEESVYNGR